MAARKSYWQRARNQMDAIDAVVCKALSGSLTEDMAYEIDPESGYTCRIFGKDEELADAEAREFLLGNRAVTVEDAYRAIGKQRMRYWVRMGYLKASSTYKNVYWVTLEAALRFDLPRVMGCKFPSAGAK